MRVRVYCEQWHIEGIYTMLREPPPAGHHHSTISHIRSCYTCSTTSSRAEHVPVKMIPISALERIVGYLAHPSDRANRCSKSTREVDGIEG